MCALLVAGFLAAPFCPIATPQRASCCDPATGCGAGLSAPDCCKYEPGQTGSSTQPTERPRASSVSADGHPVAGGDAFLASAASSAAGGAGLPPSTGDPPPLYLLHASLLR